MAVKQSNAPVSTSGVIHVRTRFTTHFTVVSNRLAQRRGSAIAQGVALYISSLPDGASVTIAALCEHFTEGEILLARALNELEAAGYLERRRERLTGGRICTRTFAYDVPRTVTEFKPRPQAPRRALATPALPAPAPAAPPPPPPATSPPVAILSSLRHRDPRLLLSEREIAQLAPAVTEWLERGADPQQVSDAMSDNLPVRLKQRPARLLAYRLATLRPPAAPDPTPPRVIVPLQHCDGCDRAYRAASPGPCRDCRNTVDQHELLPLRAAG